MKKLLLWMMIFLLTCSARAEAARDYVLWLEEALPGANYTDAEVPPFVTRNLGADYEFIARQSETHSSYIAGVRRADAPALPEGAHQTSFAGTFESPVFQAADGEGNILYQFVLARGVYLQAYDGLERLLVWIDPDVAASSDYQQLFGCGGANPGVFEAADPESRARMLYAREKGWSLKNRERCQMAFPVHNLESWQAGATNQPHSFHLDMTQPADVLGERYIGEDALIQYTRIPIGLSLMDGDLHCELVLSEDGTLGVEAYAPQHRLYEAGPGCDALLCLAERVLGYRPGDMTFTGKTSVRATLSWQGDADGQHWQAGSIALTDAERLAALDALFSAADFTVGSVNCPSPCFLTLEYADGSSADFAVAVNSFNLFFRNGMYFATQQDITGLFDLQNTDFYKAILGG